MRKASLTEAKNKLSALIDVVRAGETVLILDRGTPIARLEPIAEHPDQSGRIQRLARAGIVKSGRGRLPLALLREPGPRLKGRASAVEALLEERRGTR